MKRYADLHVHTYHSDSTLSPQEVVDIAYQKGFAAVAITDHDCVDGVQPAVEFAKKFGIEIIPGVELSAEEGDYEVHILGYLIDYKAEWFTAKLAEIRQKRVDRIYEMAEKLKERGVVIDPKKVLELSGRGSVGRLHMAQVIYNEGYTSSIVEVFHKYIGNDGPCYVKKYKLTPQESIDMILKIGGVPILAHPHILGKDELIQELVKKGLRGIEVYHSEHPNNITLHYEDLAYENNLLVTGGSDCHGMAKGNILLGRVKVPYNIVENLKKEAVRIREAMSGAGDKTK